MMKFKKVLFNFLSLAIIITSLSVSTISLATAPKPILEPKATNDYTYFSIVNPIPDREFD